MENTVTMTPAELEEFKAFKAAKAAKQAKEERKEALAAYNKMANSEVDNTVPALKMLSAELSRVKGSIFGNFKALLEMKKDVVKLTKDGQRSHTFMSTDGRTRITLGYYVIDNYKDTANDGIAMIKEYISGLAKDAETQSLVDMVLRLLSKDQKGNLKASRVLQLNAMKDRISDERFSEGVEIIMNAYDPIESKKFIRVEERDNTESEWRTVPLSITEATI